MKIIHQSDAIDVLAKPAATMLDALARQLSTATGEPYEEVRRDVELAADELGREALSGEVRSWP